MEKHDYQALQDLKNSHGWKILCETIDERIQAIEKVLLEPDDSDMFGDVDETKKNNLINYKKMERKYLISLKNIPENLLSTKINIDKKELCL